MLAIAKTDDWLAKPTAALGDFSTYFYGYFLAFLLVGVGLYFTARMYGIQFRLFRHMVASLTNSRDGQGGGISSFQAFTIGLASRVGTGNIIGVALAIIMGGPGAVFWMWVVALVGMATAFVEATLAQMYKVANPDGSFRGGPAYYITRGLKMKPLAVAFAAVIIFVFGFAYEATQANAISGIMEHTFNVPTWATGVGLLVITAPIIFGGMRQVAKVSEWIAPIMALGYVLLAAVILLLNITAIPGALLQIFKGAFGVDQALAGLAGGFTAAALNGIKRGLFSNEAGEGSVPNAAAAATTAHPVNQGFIQSMGVFVDTLLVCTATALIVLLSGVYNPAAARTGQFSAGTLTSISVTSQLGGWAQYLMAAMIFVFAYSSLLGNYTYAEINDSFLRGATKKLNHTWLRVMILVATYVGAVASLDFVWNLADVVMGIMATINIFAITIMGRWAFGALRDWESQYAQLKAGKIDEIRFVSSDNKFLPGKLPGDVWSSENAGVHVNDRAEA